MAELCGWNGCRRPEREPLVIVQALQRHLATVDGHTLEAVRLRLTVAPLGFELAGVCEHCARELAQVLGLGQEVFTRCGHARRPVNRLVEAVRRAASLGAAGILDKAPLRSVLMQVACETTGLCQECAATAVKGAELGLFASPEPSAPPHRDEKLSRAAQGLQLQLLEAPASSTRCEHCGRYHPSVAWRAFFHASWCDGCVQARVGHA